MLIGHLPAGYFLSRALIKKFKIPLTPLWLGLGLVASVAPDFDHAFNLFFQTNINDHRSLLTHIPITYFILALLGWVLYKLKPRRWLKWGLILVLPNALLHTVLDTVFIGIKWLWPFSDRYVGIYNVGYSGGFSVTDYFQHWYWYLEIALWLVAVVAVIISSKKGELK
ncbi:MAG: metal-dependent hydrolase [Candidatus Komeilibacteria bacterium]|nr:metal-dependent hydrolase [Candidatus Komeilibacteria bacterium]